MTKMRAAATTIVLLASAAFIALAYVLSGGKGAHHFIPVFGLALIVGLLADVLRVRLQKRRKVAALAAFIRARLEDDIARARSLAPGHRLLPRVLDDLQAKRQVTDVLEVEARGLLDLWRGLATYGADDRALQILERLARPYADHWQFPR